MTDDIKITIFPEGKDDGECVFLTIPESSIMLLVELLRKGCSVSYTTRRRIGPQRNGNWAVRIVRG